MDRAPALRGAGLFAVAVGAWGLGAVTPADHGAWCNGIGGHNQIYPQFSNNAAIE